MSAGARLPPASRGLNLPGVRGAQLLLLTLLPLGRGLGCPRSLVSCPLWGFQEEGWLLILTLLVPHSRSESRWRDEVDSDAHIFPSGYSLEVSQLGNAWVVVSGMILAYVGRGMLLAVALWLVLSP